jgi:putative transposase
MLIQTPDSNIDRFMYFFNKEFSRKLRLEAGLSNRMFVSNYKWCLVTSDQYFNNVFRYIYQNPLRANIVKNVKAIYIQHIITSLKKIRSCFFIAPLRN